MGTIITIGTRITGTGMAAEALAPTALIRLQSWLSPAFPVGSFSYGSGLETAAHEGRVRDQASLRDWLAALLAFGSGWNDAVLFAEAWRRAGSGADLGEPAELGAALAGSQERHLETTLQGAAFVAAARNGWPHPLFETLPDPCPYAVAVGAVAGAHMIPVHAALAVWLHAYAGNLVQAAIRLGVLGQSGAVSTIAALETAVVESAERAAASSLGDLGTATVLAEIMSMRHESHYSRLFRT